MTITFTWLDYRDEFPGAVVTGYQKFILEIAGHCSQRLQGVVAHTCHLCTREAKAKGLLFETSLVYIGNSRVALAIE